MKLYLDDDCVSKILIQLLKKAGHGVLVPSDIGTSGKADSIHLRAAINDVRATVSKNYAETCTT